MKICFVTSKTIIKHATMKRAFGMANPLCLLEHEVTICLQESEDNREAMSRCPLAQAHYYQAGSALYERRQKQTFLEQSSFDIIYICGLGVGNAINAKPLKNSFVLMDHVELESSIKDMPTRRRISQGILEWWSIFAYDASIAASRYLEFLFLSRLHLFGVSRPILWFPYAYDPDSLSINNANIAVAVAPINNGTVGKIDPTNGIGSVLETESQIEYPFQQNYTAESGIVANSNVKYTLVWSNNVLTAAALSLIP